MDKDLEKMENELGIDLVTLINVLKAGKIWIFYPDMYKRFPQRPEDCFLDWDSIVIFFEKKTIGFADKGWEEEMGYSERPLSEYGKTWAITKEELEKNNNVNL